MSTRISKFKGVGRVKKRETLISQRIKKGFTQQKLADAVGCKIRHIASLESGEKNPSLELAKKIAEVLGSTIDELF